MVLSAFLALAAAAPSGHIEYAAAPVLHKTISYAHEPVISGYSTSILKPSLGHSYISAPAHHHQLVEVQPEYHVEQPVLTKVAEHVEHVPTAVSHQSSTVVHSKAAVITPVIASSVHKTIVPAQYAYAAPAYKTVVAAPQYYAAPAHYAHAGPAHYAHAAPAHYHSW